MLKINAYYKEQKTYFFIAFLQVSSDLSVVDLDVAFKFTVAVGTTMNAYANFGVLTILAWELVFVILPTIYLSILIQVIHCCLMFS